MNKIEETRKKISEKIKEMDMSNEENLEKVSILNSMQNSINKFMSYGM